MATPLKPLLPDNEEFIAHLLKRHPQHTRESLLEEARAYGCDLDTGPPNAAARHAATARTSQATPRSAADRAGRVRGGHQPGGN